jgi:hypothetical protein
LCFKKAFPQPLGGKLSGQIAAKLCEEGLVGLGTRTPTFATADKYLSCEENKNILIHAYLFVLGKNRPQFPKNIGGNFLWVR